MKKSRYSEQQIAFALRQAEGGTAVREICRKMGISEQVASPSFESRRATNAAAPARVAAAGPALCSRCQVSSELISAMSAPFGVH